MNSKHNTEKTDYIYICTHISFIHTHTHTHTYVYNCIQAGGSDGKDYLQCGSPRFDPWDRKITQATHTRHEAETEQQQQENKRNRDSGLD